MVENLFVGNNVIQSNWDTESFVMIRHQLRARVENSTLHVQVIEQSLIERIGTWLSHFIGQNNTYAHQLKLADIKVKFQNNTDIRIEIQKILNSCCKLDKTKIFNTQNVLDDLEGQLEEEIRPAISTDTSYPEVLSSKNNFLSNSLKINSKSTVDNTERTVENEQSLLDEIIDGWQKTVDWLTNGLEQAKEFNKKEREEIEAQQKSLKDSWLDISELAAELDPEAKKAINLRIKEAVDPHKIDLNEPFQRLLVNTTNYMASLYARAGRFFPNFLPESSMHLDRESLKSGIIPIYVGIQEGLESDKGMPPELISKRDFYIRELSRLTGSINTMTGKQLQDALVDFSARQSEILQYAMTMISTMHREKEITPQEIAKDLKELIEKAYGYRDSLGFGKDPILERSLGKNLGTWSPDNRTLIKIRDKDFSHTSKEELQQDIADAISLIEKGFKESLREVPETDSYFDDRNIYRMILNLRKKIRDL